MRATSSALFSISVSISLLAACSAKDDAAPSVSNSPPDAASSAGDAGFDGPFVTAVHRPWPQIPANSGRVLRPMKLVTIVASNEVLSDRLFSFGDALIASSWWRSVGSEYAIGPATHVKVTGPAITQNSDPPTAVRYIQSALGDGTAPAPDGNTLYLIYLPPNVTDAGVQDAVGYHAPFPAPGQGSGDAFAVVSRGQRGAHETELDQLTNTASHEILEAATDPGDFSWRLPDPSLGPWNESVWNVSWPGEVELADLCWQTRIRESVDGGPPFEYQRSWSNAAAQTGGGDPCVPALPRPYENVSTPQDWYSASSGQTIQIPFTGWSSQPSSDWLTFARVSNARGTIGSLGFGTGLDITTPLGPGNVAPCLIRPAMNNGVTGTLTVQVPASAARGDYAVVLLMSFHEASDCYESTDDDVLHYWPVGVYVE